MPFEYTSYNTENAYEYNNCLGNYSVCQFTFICFDFKLTAMGSSCCTHDDDEDEPVSCGQGKCVLCQVSYLNCKASKFLADFYIYRQF